MWHAVWIRQRYADEAALLAKMEEEKTSNLVKAISMMYGLSMNSKKASLPPPFAK